MSSLDLTLLYLIAAVLGVTACRWLRLPAILGYLVVGVVIEPHTLGFAFGQDAESIRHLAEYGVVFLMFVIGLEFNLGKLRAMRRHVFGLGMLQVVLTMLVITFGSIGLAMLVPAHWQVSWQTSLALASAVAMSSTAVVAKLLAERAELESGHGQRVMGVLLFQDLAVVPLLVLIPALGASPEQLAGALLTAGLKAAFTVSLLLWGGQKLMRWWLTLVARRKSEELFMLNVLLVTLGLAWLTEHAGLSLALGAFIAGVLISETEFRVQVETDIRPFHDVLLGLFFITIGMLLDWRLVLLQWPLVLALVVGPVLFKLLLVAGLARLLGAHAGTALRTGLYLAQAGEFGFVLLTLAGRHSLIAPQLFNPVLAAMVLSMLATPFIIMASNRIVLRLVSSEWMQQSLQMTSIARQTINTAGHVVICGYGRCGRSLARLLEQEKIPYIALEADPDRVHEAHAAGDKVAYGDAAKPQSLVAAGLARASALVITYLDTASALKVLHHAHEHAPQVPVIVRTQHDRDLEKLRAAGATEVVPEALEGALILASHALALAGVPVRRVLRAVQDQREHRYNLLRGYQPDPGDAPTPDEAGDRMTAITLPTDSPLAGKPLAEALASVSRVRVVNLRRRSGLSVAATEDTSLLAGDTLLLSGHEDALAAARAALGV